MSNIFIRPYQDTDRLFLWEMLYQAIYVPANESPPSREILMHPSIHKYLKNWPVLNDRALIAVDGHFWGGAIWMRRFNRDNAGYGFVNDATPEISMALLPKYRSQGIGRRLLTQLADEARASGCPALSLSVDVRNAVALHLYETSGFIKVQDNKFSWTMIKVL